MSSIDQPLGRKPFREALDAVIAKPKISGLKDVVKAAVEPVLQKLLETPVGSPVTRADLKHASGLSLADARVLIEALKKDGVIKNAGTSMYELDPTIRDTTFPPAPDLSKEPLQTFEPMLKERIQEIIWELAGFDEGADVRSFDRFIEDHDSDTGKLVRSSDIRSVLADLRKRGIIERTVEDTYVRVPAARKSPTIAQAEQDLQAQQALDAAAVAAAFSPPTPTPIPSMPTGVPPAAPPPPPGPPPAPTGAPATPDHFDVAGDEYMERVTELNVRLNNIGAPATPDQAVYRSELLVKMATAQQEFFDWSLTRGLTTQQKRDQRQYLDTQKFNRLTEFLDELDKELKPLEAMYRAEGRAEWRSLYVLALRRHLGKIFALNNVRGTLSPDETEIHKDASVKDSKEMIRNTATFFNQRLAAIARREKIRGRLPTNLSENEKEELDEARARYFEEKNTVLPSDAERAAIGKELLHIGNAIDGIKSNVIRLLSMRKMTTPLRGEALSGIEQMLGLAQTMNGRRMPLSANTRRLFGILDQAAKTDRVPDAVPEFKAQVIRFVESLRQDYQKFTGVTVGSVATPEPVDFDFEELPNDYVEAISRPDFRDFFKKFDAVKDRPWFKGKETEPFDINTDFGQQRFERAQEAFSGLQSAIKEYRKITNAKVKADLKMEIPASRQLAINKKFEEMVIEDPRKLNALIEKMQLATEQFGRKQVVDEQGKPIDGLERPGSLVQEMEDMNKILETEDARDALVYARDKRLPEERDQLKAEYEQQLVAWKAAKTTLYYAKEAEEMTTGFKGFMGKLFSSGYANREAWMKTRYGLTLKQAAEKLKSFKREEKWERRKLNMIGNRFGRVLENYQKVRKSINSIDAAQKRKTELEAEFATLRHQVFKDSQMFKETMSTFTDGLRADLIGTLTNNPTPEKIAEVAKKLEQIEQSKNPRVSEDYEGMIDVTNVSAELVEAAKKSVRKLLEEFLPEKGTAKQLMDTMKSYGDKSKAVILESLQWAIEQEEAKAAGKNEDKIIVLKAILLRLNV